MSVQLESTVFNKHFYSNYNANPSVSLFLLLHITPSRLISYCICQDHERTSSQMIINFILNVVCRVHWDYTVLYWIKKTKDTTQFQIKSSVSFFCSGCVANKKRYITWHIALPAAQCTHLPFLACFAVSAVVCNAGIWQDYATELGLHMLNGKWTALI